MWKKQSIFRAEQQQKSFLKVNKFRKKKQELTTLVCSLSSIRGAANFQTAC